MKVKTAELTGAALDWAVAKCEGRRIVLIDSFLRQRKRGSYNYSTNWLEGGLIIQREKIGVGYTTEGGETWLAAMSDDPFYISGPTALIAAMRCYVTSKMGEWVEVPDELL